MDSRIVFPAISRLLILLLCCLTSGALADELPGLDPKVDIPSSRAGMKDAEFEKALVLNVYRREGADEPRVVADLKDRGKGVELPIAQQEDHSLRKTIAAESKRVGKGFHIVINAPRDLRYAGLQIVLTQCAVAGTDVRLATRDVASGEIRFLSSSRQPPAAREAIVTPTKLGDDPPQPVQAPAPGVTVHVETIVDGNSATLRARVRDRTCTDRQSLVAALDDLRKYFEHGDVKAVDVELAIVPEATTQYEQLIAVYDAALEAKLPKIAFAQAH